MPPKKKAAPKAAIGRYRKSARGKRIEEPTIPDVYQEMLAEVVTTSGQEQSSRAVKRRKVTEGVAAATDPTRPSSAPDTQYADGPTDTSGSPNQQVVYDDFEDSEEDEFEDVDLSLSEAEDKPEFKTITVELTEPLDTPRNSVSRRPIASPAERKMRLEWHKAHLFLLLLSLWCRNKWCESQEVHSILKPLVPRKIVKLLHEDESKPQVQRSYSFNKGIEEICQLWRTTWTTTARGIRRAVWRDDINTEKESNLAEDLDFDDFKSATHTQRGSRDLGAQLFCALLRSVAVDARLVSSLQVLPFSAAAKGQTPQKATPGYAYAPPQNYGSSNSTGLHKKIKDSPYPVYWVEVFSPSSSTWIPLDPLVRHTINKPKTGFEPPASDMLNSMSYVVAFEDDGSAKDVTRRYAQWYNAKTRKTRVESTKGGENWWRTTLAPFAKPFREDRDDLEDSDLRRRCEAEGLPKNIQDFKGHPVYVLERHLRINEVIQPKREVGKTAVGGGHKSQKLESVYRRNDVHLCRSADAWYRRGRDVKQGEVPLKRMTKTSRRDLIEDEDGMPAQDQIPLYAEFQTEIYEPPPVDNGRIPRNDFGNIDIYVPSMIPAGAVHVQHPLATKAAKLMGIPYVEAVTGFDFKGRQGTAIINGVVISAEARFGLVTVIIGLQTDAIAQARAERSALLLALWKRWLVALRIRNRIQHDYGDGDDAEEEDDPNYQEQDQDSGGGFMPENVERSTDKEHDTMEEANNPKSKILLKGLPSEPSKAEIVVLESPHKLAPITKPPTAKPATLTSRDALSPNPSAGEPGGFFADTRGGFVVDDEKHSHFMNQRDVDVTDDMAGGFMVDDDEPMADEDPTYSSHRVLDKAMVELQHPDTNIRNPEPSGSILYPSESERTMVTERRLSPIGLGPAEEGRVEKSDSATAPARSPNDIFSGSEAEDRASATSMLSHDPDEDDLEPEWLVDNLGD